MTTATTTEPAALPKPIATKLAALRGHLRRIDAILGLVRVAIAVLAFVVSTFVLDRMLDLPTAFRAVVLALGAGAVAWVAWRRLIEPLSVRRTDDDLALMVERAHPELNDGLISAVQLSRSGFGHSGAFHSQELVQVVVEEAAEKAERVDFERVADAKGLRRLAALTLAVAAITGALFWTRPRDARIWLERTILLRDTPWPRSVELEVRLAAQVVAKGDDVTISARVLRGAPSRVVVIPAFRGTYGGGDEVPMVEARGEWRATLENVSQSFRFYVEGGDYRSRWYEVRVRPRPKVEEVRVWLAHPPYTGIADTPAAEPLLDGNLKVPGGTLVRYEVLASDELRESEIIFSAPQAVADLKVEAPGAPGAPGAAAGARPRAVRGEFRVKDSTAWTVRLVSAEGFESPAAATYQIRAIPDRLPDVRIVKPGRNKDVARGAAVPLRVEVKDDYLPRAAALVFAVARRRARAAEGGPAGAGAPPDETRVGLAGLPSPEPAKEARLEHVFELGQASLEPGDRITYWVEAVDNRAPLPDVLSVPVESRGRSERYQLHVVSDEDLDRATQAALKRAGEDLLASAKAQEAARAEVQSLAQDLASRLQPDPRDRKRLTYAELDQRKIAQRVEQARRSLAEVREEMAANRVAKEVDVRWVGDLAAQAERLVTDQIARASADLSALRQAERPDAGRALEVARVQAEIADALHGLVKQLAKWDEVNEVVRNVRDLMRAEEEIKRKTEERAKEDLNR